MRLEIHFAIAEHFDDQFFFADLESSTKNNKVKKKNIKSKLRNRKVLNCLARDKMRINN